jgi:MoxR-like ATPase
MATTASASDIAVVAERIARERARVLAELRKVIVGQDGVIDEVLMALFTGGHCLITGVPGLAKTLLIKTVARILDLSFKRIQFTPDLMPADITGTEVLDEQEGHRSLRFMKGPIFAQIILADEINRTPPKTQAALLEAMQEGQVTVEDTTYPLPPPFVVIATQNPIEYEGTYPLPEAQLDRFMLRVGVGYPDRDQEWEILQRRIARGQDEVSLESVVGAAGLIDMQESLEGVYVGESVGYYLVDVAAATRSHPDVQVGASPRGALALLKLARGRALLDGRDFVTPDDVKAVAVAALAHRLTLRPELWVRRVTGIDVVGAVLGQVPAPAAEEPEQAR